MTKFNPNNKLAAIERAIKLRKTFTKGISQDFLEHELEILDSIRTDYLKLQAEYVEDFHAKFPPIR